MVEVGKENLSNERYASVFLAQQFPDIHKTARANRRQKGLSQSVGKLFPGLTAGFNSFITRLSILLP